ncbi:MAG: imelysin family protein [Polyangiaceae bacterium]
MNAPKKALLGLACAVAVASAACDGSSTDAPDDASKAAVTTMHATVLGDLDKLVAATKALQAAAPVVPGRGWDKVMDAAAIQTMKARWADCRIAYEHVEGALAPIFPDLDASIDARYDDFIAENGADEDLFDDQNVTGLHAAERIIYALDIPESVVELESSLPGYKAAAYPATEAEATAFRDKLLAKMVKDAEALRDQWTPANIDLPGAFTGLVALMSEQREKVNKAGNQEEESRYSQKTMFDLRANLEGTRRVYEAFRPWLKTLKSADPEKDGPTLDAAILAGFDGLDAVYDTIDGDAFPSPPATWSAESPSAADLMTPFGKLYVAVTSAVDPARDGSIVHEMNHAAEALGLE